MASILALNRICMKTMTFRLLGVPLGFTAIAALIIMHFQFYLLISPVHMTGTM
jgi:hypothetical protein